MREVVFRPTPFRPPGTAPCYSCIAHGRDQWLLLTLSSKCWNLLLPQPSTAFRLGASICSRMPANWENDEEYLQFSRRCAKSLMSCTITKHQWLTCMKLYRNDQGDPGDFHVTDSIECWNRMLH